MTGECTAKHALQQKDREEVGFNPRGTSGGSDRISTTVAAQSAKEQAPPHLWHGLSVQFYPARDRHPAKQTARIAGGPDGPFLKATTIIRQCIRDKIRQCIRDNTSAYSTIPSAPGDNYGDVSVHSRERTRTPEPMGAKRHVRDDVGPAVAARKRQLSGRDLPSGCP